MASRSLSWTPVFIWRWMELKIRSLKFIAFCCSLCWILHLLINSCVPIVVQGSLKGKNFRVNNYGYCSSCMKGGVLDLLTAVTYFSPHFLSLGVTVWASGSLVLVLHRHKQWVQHICSNWLSPRPPMRPEPHAPSWSWWALLLPFIQPTPFW